MKRKLTASATALITIILFVISCNKIDTTNLGSDLIPAVDNISTFEKYYDVVTDNRLFNDTTRMLYGADHVLGLIENDLEFGKTSSTVYASFTPTSYRTYPFLRRENVIIDSVILSLGFTSIFGDTNAIQQLEVHEIEPSATFSDSAHYLVRPDFPVNPATVGLGTVNYRISKDTVVYRNGTDTIKSVRQVRIPMDTAWARRFVGYDTAAGQPFYSDSLFKLSFKGLQIAATESSPGKNALAYIDLSDADKSRITFYCRVTNSGGGIDTIAPYFSYTDDPHATIVKRTPANAYLANVTNEIPNDERLYIQSAPGSYATVRIPQLDTISNYVIHRAELVCEPILSADPFYAVPNRLFIEGINNSGDSVFTIRNDFVPTNASPFYDLASLGGNYSRQKYVFNLSRYVQSIATKKLRNYTLRISAPYSTSPNYLNANTDQVNTDMRRMLIVNSPIAYGRVILHGGAGSDPRRMRLRIIYSYIK